MDKEVLKVDSKPKAQAKKKDMRKWTNRKVTHVQRNILIDYLTKFYNYYPDEKFTVFHFVKYFKQRLKNNKDAWVGVSGETGTGKSLFVLSCQILFGRPFNLTDNVAYIPTGDQIKAQLDKLTFNTLLIDEAARDMRAVNWQKKSQQKVNVTAMTDRFKNNWIFLNMPNFNEFTKSMRVGSLIFRCIIPYRTATHARIILQRKSRNWRSDDPWGDTLANERYERAEKKYGEIDNELILSIERSLPNTIMDFMVPNLELILPEITEEYELLKRESRDVADKEEEVKAKPDNLYKRRYESLLANVTKIIKYNSLNLGKVKLSQKEMCAAIGISNDAFKKYLVADPKSFESKAKSRLGGVDKNDEEGKVE